MNCMPTCFSLLPIIFERFIRVTGNILISYQLQWFSGFGAFVKVQCMCRYDHAVVTSLSKKFYSPYSSQTSSVYINCMGNVKQLYSDCAFPNAFLLSETPSSHCSSPSSCLMGTWHVWGRWPDSALGHWTRTKAFLSTLTIYVLTGPLMTT